MKALNRLESSHGIDTLEREQALDGFVELLKAGGIEQQGPWLERFDAWRDF